MSDSQRNDVPPNYGLESPVCCAEKNKSLVTHSVYESKHEGNKYQDRNLSPKELVRNLRRWTGNQVRDCDIFHVLSLYLRSSIVLLQCNCCHHCTCCSLLLFFSSPTPHIKQKKKLTVNDITE